VRELMLSRADGPEEALVRAIFDLFRQLDERLA
jgi:hypothetical protein